jgi:predicted nucleic acid-binding protein
VHPLVVGELACGNIANRREVLSLLHDLSIAPVATHEEALAFIEARFLMGRGIGYIDVHLLASAALSGGGTLWTLDRRLKPLAQDMGLAYEG